MLKSDVRRPKRMLSVSPGMIRAANWLGEAAVLFLFSRAQLFGELSPLAPACFSAGMTCGWLPGPMLAGCVLAALVYGGKEIGWMPALACAMSFGVHFLAKRRRNGSVQADFLAGAAAGLPILAAGVLFSGGIRYNLLLTFLNAAVASTVAPAMRSAMGVTRERRVLMPDEQLSLSLFTALLLTGLRSLPGAGECVSGAAAVLVTLIFSGAGCGMGAMAGLVSGAALAMVGDDPMIGSTLGLCGVLAGCMRQKGRPAACAAFALGSLFTVTAGIGYRLGEIGAASVALGCAAWCVVPERVLNRLHGWMEPVRLGADPEKLSERLRRKAGRRISELSEVFGALADGYSEEKGGLTEQQLLSEARERICAGCAGYEACWQGENARAGRMICRMAAEAFSGKKITRAGDMPPDLIRHCRRSGRIDRRLVPWLESLSERRGYELRREEARLLLAGQFRQTQRILDHLATQMKGGVCLSGEYARMARAALEKAGIEAQETVALLDDRLEVICALKKGRWDGAAARRAAAFLGDELGIPMSPVLKGGCVPDECELHLIQAPGLTAAIGEAALPAKEGVKSGDSRFARILPDGRLIALLSDGMGSGEEAARESERCISLLRKFIGAGIERDASLSAVNRLMVLRGGEEMFATADVCVVDLYTGEAEFSKLGACRSFILSERGICRIQGGRLPMGILDRVEPAVQRAQVHPGSMIVMISDGIADELKEGQMSGLEKVLMEVRRRKPEEAARRILEYAGARDEGRERDDMTVLAVRILARKI